jgi:excisionase family DNA binding protein
MTVSEVAAYLNCHPSTVYRFLKGGELPAFHLGGDWRFLRTELDKWIAERQVRPYVARKRGGRGHGKRGSRMKGN